MSPDLCAVDMAMIPKVAEADSTNYLGDLQGAGQACRAVFLAIQVGAISWDSNRWPDLTMGVWSDDASPAQKSFGRRRKASATADLATWIQLRPDWPQFNGRTISWPLDGATDFTGRLVNLLIAATTELNAAYAAVLSMAAVLNPPTAAAGAVTVPRRRSERRTFTSARIATSETDVAQVLAELAGAAETEAHRLDAIAHVSHAVTALPNSYPVRGGQPQVRYLVTIVAAIDSP